MDLKVGDTVRLKSGGPLMTVENIGKGRTTGDDQVWCTWYDQTAKKIERDAFPPGVLEKSEKGGIATVRVERA